MYYCTYLSRIPHGGESVCIYLVRDKGEKTGGFFLLLNLQCPSPNAIQFNQTYDSSKKTPPPAHSLGTNRGPQFETETETEP